MIRSFQELDKDSKSREQQHQWNAFQSRAWGKCKWKEEWEDVIFDLTSNRVGPAHSTSLESDDEEVVSPDQLKDAASTMYKSKELQETKESIHDIVDFLDQITRELQRPLLS